MADDLEHHYYKELAHWEYDDTYYNDIHYSDFLKKYLQGKLKWCKKDGTKIPIQKMDDSHLLNSIKWIDNHHSKSTCMLELKEILLIEKYNRKL